MTWANGAQSNAKTAYDYEVGANKIDKTYEAKIGLMYLSEYYYSASPLHWAKPGYNSDATKDYRSAVNDNWMYMGHYEWIISPSTDNAYGGFCVYTYGYVFSGNVYNNYNVVRPVFNLILSVELAGGSGSMTDPYRIS